MEPLRALDRDAEPTYYELLDVPPGATAREIERAYRIARETYRPGSPALYSLLDEAEAARILARIEEAYAVLSDPARRRAYDERLAREGRSPRRAAAEGTPSSGGAARGPAEGRARAAAQLGLEAAEPEDGVYTGEVLRRIRIARGVEIAEIAERSKVNPTYLEFIEAERFEELPAAVYVRGFLVEYARCVGLDPRRVAESYMARYRAALGRRR